MELLTNDPSQPSFTVVFEGYGEVSVNSQNPTLGDLDNQTDCGNVAVGHTVTKAFRISNAGPTTVISSIVCDNPFTLSKISSVSSTTGLSAGDSLAAPPFSLGPGASIVVAVGFTPSATGTFSGNVTITANGVTQWVIPMAGTGQ
jgi:hypothetical protein